MDPKLGNTGLETPKDKRSGNKEDALYDTSRLPKPWTTTSEDGFSEPSLYPTLDTEEMTQLVENQTIIEFKTCKSKSPEQEMSENQVPSDEHSNKENINTEGQSKEKSNVSRLKGFKGPLSNISSFAMKKSQSKTKLLKQSPNQTQIENTANDTSDTKAATISVSVGDTGHKIDISPSESKVSKPKISDLKSNFKGSIPSLPNFKQIRKMDQEKDHEDVQKCNCIQTEKNSIKKEVIKEITTKGGQTIELEKWLAKQPYNVSVVDKDLGMTVLHLACDGNHIDAVKVIMAHHPCLNIKDGANDTPVRVAIKQENFQCIVECLKETQCVLNIRDKKEATKLIQRKTSQVLQDCQCRKFPVQKIDNKIIAAITKKSKARKLVNLITQDESFYAVQRWLMKGNNVNLVDTETRQTILHLASNYNREDIVAIIVDYEPCMTLVDDNKETAMLIAWRKGHLGCLRILLNANDISCEAFVSAKKCIFDQLKKHHKKEGEFINMRNQNPNPSGSICLRITHMPQELKVKMNRWKDSLWPNDDTTSESEVSESNEEFYVDDPTSNQALLIRNTNKDLQTTWRLCGCSMKNKELNKDVERVIVGNGDVKTIRKWINDKEKKVNAITKSKGQTALHLACEYNRVNVVDVLLEHNPCLTVKDNNNETPAMIALRKNNQECLQRLVQAKDTKCNVEEHYRREGALIKELEKELHIDKFKLMNKFSAMLPVFSLLLMILSILGSELLVSYTSYFSIFHHCGGDNDNPVEIITFISYPLKLSDEKLNICNGNSVNLHLEGDISYECRSFRNCCIWMALFATILLLYSLAFWWISRRPESKLLPLYLKKKLRKCGRSRKSFYAMTIFCIIATIVWLAVSKKLKDAISKFESSFDIDLIEQKNPGLCGGYYDCEEGEPPNLSSLTHAKNQGFCAAILCTVFFIPLYLWMKLSSKLKKTSNLDQQLNTKKSNPNMASVSHASLA
ncbi:unnamed protein product [Meganyctiphanes norvegica]|uniref:Uncharacterized protein n=1 Tax=Meganyctiphanes norvegica TaxID=48144 RepID=A0AAV2R8C0_MEGNR